MIAETPKPPYYAVIFTTLVTDTLDGYEETANQMVEMVSKQDGFLGFEAAREDIGITVSYWKDLASIKAWKENTEHTEARNKGRENWYKAYKTRICKVERDYGLGDI
ncbi:antibiotic biosynthesis monooxygenase [Flammeovirga pectinis]|uniref:Antibiotic biosynthesis monooxygenase n=1 Tax=Flammeovirga pectinis TaxID=2494373 RepID=A0A3Q9FU41_9BACT|nr:antibiotic biosynthesis monooxygenase [Flammeovirga pectinis]AZQ64642.1 antibiotic biosynthesis monooxygenase [Flammeovirga pectinis]